MVFKIFQDKGSLEGYFSKNPGWCDMLVMDFDRVRQEAVEMTAGNSWAASLRQKVQRLEVPVSGNLELLYYSPTRGYGILCLDASLDGGVLSVLCGERAAFQVLGFLRNFQEEVNQEAALHNQAAAITG